MAPFSRSATVRWTGDIPRGTGTAAGATGSFEVPISFPRIAGDPPGATTPEELLAASHATCFGIGLRSVIAQRRGSATRVVVTATITADKGGGGIRILSSHLEGRVEGLQGIDSSELDDVARAAEAGCTISAAIRAAVGITVHVVAE